jgi:hypothetical protein
MVVKKRDYLEKVDSREIKNDKTKDIIRIVGRANR